MKKIIPALALLLISAMVLASASYAWFSMNTTVTATGMTVKAKAEGGLVISSTAADNTWSNTAAVVLDKEIKLLPASTADGDTWYHAHSNASNSSVSTGYYELVASGTDSDPTGASLGSAGVLGTANDNPFSTGSGAIVYDENGSDSVYTVDTDDGFYLLTKYFIRSSGDAITVNTTDGEYKALAINAVKVATANGSAQLDKCLRIGVQLYNENNAKVGNFVVLAPMAGADGATGSTTTPVTGGTDVAALVGLASNSVTTYYANANTGFAASIPSNTSGKYLTANVYVWFEGEDSTCISDNLTSNLDSLSIEVSFKITKTAAQYANVATASEP